MERGDVEGKIIEIAMREGRELPKKIANAPELHFGLNSYYDAFCELSSCRSVSDGGEGFIPWTAMNEYCGLYAIHGEDRVRFFNILQLLDRAYLKKLVEIRKQKMKEATKAK